MGALTAETASLREAISAHREQFNAVLERYGASNPRLFGSVARGDATATSDIDLLVDLHPGVRNSLLQISGIAEELSNILGAQVDVVTQDLLRDQVSATVRADAIPL
jgi:predicted nucleotidyltransferase